MNNALRIALAIVVVAGCGGGSSEPDMFAKDTAVTAIAKIIEKTGYARPRAYMVKVTSEQLTVRLEDPAKPGTLQEWWFYEGKARGPAEVTLLGEGSIELGLFDLADVDFAAIPVAVERARTVWKLKQIDEMEVRVRDNAEWKEGGLRHGLKFAWSVRGTTADGKVDWITVSPDGNVPVPHAVQVANHVKAGEWEQALSLCDYSSMKRVDGVAEACQAVFEPALAHLEKAGEAIKVRRICLQAERIGGTLATACGGRSATP
jgi:hypothetical protein